MAVVYLLLAAFAVGWLSLLAIDYFHRRGIQMGLSSGFAPKGYLR